MFNRLIVEMFNCWGAGSYNSTIQQLNISTKKDPK